MRVVHGAVQRLAGQAALGEVVLALALHRPHGHRLVALAGQNDDRYQQRFVGAASGQRAG